MSKSGREVMEILEAFDLTQCPHSAAALAGCDEKTVLRYVAIRDGGGDVFAPMTRPSAGLRHSGLLLRARTSASGHPSRQGRGYGSCSCSG